MHLTFELCSERIVISILLTVYALNRGDCDWFDICVSVLHATFRLAAIQLILCPLTLSVCGRDSACRTAKTAVSHNITYVQQLWAGEMLW